MEARVNLRRKKELRLDTGVALHPCIIILLETDIHRITRLLHLVTWEECRHTEVSTVATGVVAMDRRVTCIQLAVLPRLITCHPVEGLLRNDKDGVIIGAILRPLVVQEEMAPKTKNLREST